MSQFHSQTATVRVTLLVIFQPSLQPMTDNYTPYILINSNKILLTQRHCLPQVRTFHNISIPSTHTGDTEEDIDEDNYRYTDT